MMQSTLSRALLGSVLVGVAAAQFSPQPRTFARTPAAAATRPQRVVTGDFTADLLADTVLLTNSGQLVLMSAVEVMSASAIAPWTGWTDVTAIAPSTQGESDVLIAVRAGILQNVKFVPGVGFSMAPLGASGWGTIQRVEARRLDSTTALLVAIDTDGVTVRVGVLQMNTLQVAIGPTIVAASPIVRAGIVEFLADGSHDIAVQTATSLAIYLTDGSFLQSFNVPAGATGGPFAPIVRPGLPDRLAWAVHETDGWHLKIVGRAGLLQDLLLQFPNLTPHFNLQGLASGDLDGDGDFDLVVHQSSNNGPGVQQYVLLNVGGATPFSATNPFAWTVPGVTAADLASVVVAEMNNTTTADVVIMANDTLQVVAGLGEVLPPGLLQYPRYYSSASFIPASNPSQIAGINLVLTVPAAYVGGGWQTEVVTYHQTVNTPQGPASFGASYCDNNGVIAPAVPTTPTTSVPLTTVFGAAPTWTPLNHYYFRVRFVLRNASGAVIGSSPAEMIGFLADGAPDGDFQNFAYMRTISVPSGPDSGSEHSFSIAAPKQVGRIKDSPQVLPPFLGVPVDA